MRIGRGRRRVVGAAKFKPKRNGLLGGVAYLVRGETIEMVLDDLGEIAIEDCLSSVKPEKEWFEKASRLGLDRDMSERGVCLGDLPGIRLGAIEIADVEHASGRHARDAIAILRGVGGPDGKKDTASRRCALGAQVVEQGGVDLRIVGLDDKYRLGNADPYLSVGDEMIAGAARHVAQRAFLVGIPDGERETFQGFLSQATAAPIWRAKEAVATVKIGFCGTVVVEPDRLRGVEGRLKQAIGERLEGAVTSGRRAVGHDIVHVGGRHLDQVEFGLGENQCTDTVGLLRGGYIGFIDVRGFNAHGRSIRCCADIRRRGCKTEMEAGTRPVNRNIRRYSVGLYGASGFWQTFAMLADQVNEKTTLTYPDGTSHDRLLRPLRDRLADAKLFVFGPEAVQMAANVALGKPSSVVAALPWVRLPARTTWIEFSNLDMRQAMAALGSPNIKAPNAQVTVMRTGFLLREEDGVLVMDYVHADRTSDGRTILDLSGARLHFELDPSRPSPGTAPTGVVHGDAAGRVRQHLKLVSEDPAEAAAEASLRQRFFWSSHPDMALAAASLAKLKGWESVRETEENQASDAWRMFGGLILPALILLNCKNAVDADQVEPSAKLNKSRIAKGRAPLRAHSVVRMHLTAARRRKSESGRGGQVASAFVIGHFKVRQPRGRSQGGVFWWSPHMRVGLGEPGKRTTIVTS